MSKKRTHAQGRASLNVIIPAHIADRVKQKLHDPVYGRVRYGAMSKLITDLLIKWLEEHGEKTTDETEAMKLEQFMKKEAKQ